MALPTGLFAQSWDKADYNGYRCAIIRVQDVRVDDKKIRFTCSVANTGRETLRLEPVKQANAVLFTSDGSLDKTSLLDEQQLVALAILSSGLTLKPGEMASKKKFEIERNATLQALPPAQQPVFIEGELSDSPSETPPHTGSTEGPFIPLVDPDRQGCPDLVIDSLWVLDTRKNSMQVAVRLINQGDGPAKLYTADREDKGMGISFYFGSSEHISRGSLFIQGEHIDDGLNESQGQLLPGHSLIKEVKVDTRRHTRFLTALQCRLDTFQRVVECDETNNEFIYFLR